MDCPSMKNDSISRVSKCPKTKYVYIQVSKPSGGHKNCVKCCQRDKVCLGRRSMRVVGSTKQTFTWENSVNFPLTSPNLTCVIVMGLFKVCLLLFDLEDYLL